MEKLDDMLGKVDAREQDIVSEFKRDYLTAAANGSYSAGCECDGESCDCYACNSGCYISDC